jgi:hypothetical protein
VFRRQHKQIDEMSVSSMNVREMREYALVMLTEVTAGLSLRDRCIRGSITKAMDAGQHHTVEAFTTGETEHAPDNLSRR